MLGLPLGSLAWFAGIESGLGYFNDGTVPDSAATVAAGMLTLAPFSVLHTFRGALLFHLMSRYSWLIITLICAGFGTGALFRSARGGRAAAVAGAVGAVAASGLVAARQTVSSNL